MVPHVVEKYREDADETLWFELIIATERVDGWLDGVRQGKKSACLELLGAVQNPAYQEAARKAGVVHELTKLLGRTVDEELMDAAAAIITACSGPMSCGGKVRAFDYDGCHVVIKEGALGDGLGAKVWTVAHVLAREISSAPQLVRGRRVLEIGAGCGLNGIVAAKCGAAEVVLTDNEGPVLRNLAECMAMNAGESGVDGVDGVDGVGGVGGVGASASAGGGSWRAQQRDGRAAVPDDKELFDDAEEVDDFGDMGHVRYH
ncbi:hypothetical protein FOA52_004896 [Chlamydomonas sp. UWO 241]|nr:hypothetical protein FOA52_004896 [Chlamydomonas sp. UWO 241]